MFTGITQRKVADQFRVIQAALFPATPAPPGCSAGSDGRSPPPDAAASGRNRPGQPDSLSDEDQQALIVLMDSLLKRSKMTQLLTS
jgi:hypothetical protein